MVIPFFLLLFLLFFTSFIFFIMHAACILIGLIYCAFNLLYLQGSVGSTTPHLSALRCLLCLFICLAINCIKS